MDLSILDVAVGLIFLYLTLALFVTVLQELLASWLSLRSRTLFYAVVNLLNDPALQSQEGFENLVADFYCHPLISALYRGKLPEKPTLEDLEKLRLPSYLPSRSFAIALLDILRGKAATKALGINDLFGSAGELVQKLPENSALRRTLTLLVADTKTLEADLNDRALLVSTRIEGWFNDSMARASGWYKRQAQGLSLAIGIGLALVLNANTFEVASNLWHDDTLRGVVAEHAAAYYRDHKDAPSANVTSLSTSLVVFPIGWKGNPIDVITRRAEEHADGQAPRLELSSALAGVLSWLFGGIVTGVAASLGAAFWFDLLGRALQLRGVGERISPLTGLPEPTRSGPPQPPASGIERKVA